MQFFLSRFSTVLIHLIFTVLFFYSTYFMILGGAAIFLGTLSGLWVMYICSQSCSHPTLRYVFLALISLLDVVALISHISLWWMLLLHVLIIVRFRFKQQAITQYNSYTYALLLLGLFGFGYHQQHAMQQLKQHYASFQTNETWQKFGAL
ncbi:hypothetical protein [Acinetobacter sp.]|uniref:hypothetical protein n=1 Tax=Acinetobacter sp. TaxID=472 RepID=UPI0031D7A5AC